MKYISKPIEKTRTAFDCRIKLEGILWVFEESSHKKSEYYKKIFEGYFNSFLDSTSQNQFPQFTDITDETENTSLLSTKRSKKAKNEFSNEKNIFFSDLTNQFMKAIKK